MSILPGHWARTRSAVRAEGFTLIEVAIAVAILGVALVTLIGLQTRMLDSFDLERKRERAAMYAAYLMGVVETQKEAPAVGGDEGDLEDYLRKAGYFDGEPREERKEERDSLEGWRYVLTVTEFLLPFAEEIEAAGAEEGNEKKDEPLRQVQLTIQWGVSAGESYSLLYIMTPKNQV